MFVQAFNLLVFFGLQATAASFRHQSFFNSGRQCPDGVHIVGVRGTMEEPGFGELSKLLPGILARFPGSDTYAIDYPGTGISMDPDDPDAQPQYNLTEYVASEAEGYTKLMAEISSFTADCPGTGIVLMGYSQASTIQKTDLRFYDH
jgi:acetylxylan esterase